MTTRLMMITELLKWRRFWGLVSAGRIDGDPQQNLAVGNASVIQFGVGRSMWSMTSNSVGICLLSSLSPN
jgi:hypothetical protein